MPNSNFNINQLQDYIKQKRDEYTILTKPGYEVYFFSRFNSTAAIIPYIQSPVSLTGGNNAIPSLAAGNITPNAYLTSNIHPGDVASVRSIRVHNTVQDMGGSTCEIEIVNPDGIDYFKQTLGTIGVPGSNTTTDYDDSNGKPITAQKIGTMDTVFIRLKNYRTIPSKDNREDCETVFRGVIKSISRGMSPTGGAIMTIRLGDFSEFLRQISALPLQMFSTINLSPTGRGLVNNLLKYSNRLYTGDWRFLGTNLNQAFTNSVLPIAETISPATDQTAAILAQNSTNHAMSVPPFFYLEYSNQMVDIQNNLSGAASLPANGSDANANSQSDSQGMPGQIVNSIVNTFVNSVQAGFFQQTPEDQETIKYYSVALQKSIGDTNVNKLSTPQSIVNSGMQNIQKFAWIVSDLYLDKGLITFEHQRIWPLMYNAGQRSMRGVFFDFAPKLSPKASHPYETATVPEQNQNPGNLPDIHPNIGIVKYRLSPCMKPYDENNSSQIFQWSVSDDEIVNYDTMESEEEVYTVVYGFGSDADPASLTESANQSLAGAGKGLLSVAHSIDQNLEQRVGYRFMTDSDQKVRIPFLIYLTSYVMLMQSQMNMFTAQITVLGNPKYKPGSVIRLLAKHTDYYCTDVIHNWSMQGYTTVLVLSYGHTSGILPTPLTGGSLNDNTASNEQCQLKAQALSSFVPLSKRVGGVCVLCLISAMWQFMTCGATTDAALKQATPEFENSNTGATETYEEWITYVGGESKESRNNPPTGYTAPSIGSYDHQILNEIQAAGLDRYNLTPNTIKNLIAAESSWVADVVSGDGGYGWFQLTGKQNLISNQDAIYNFPKACGVAMGVLKDCFNRATGGNPSASTGKAFLGAIVGYNYGPGYASASNWNFAAGGNSANQPYVYQVFGKTQADAIASGAQLPSNAYLANVNSGLVCQKPIPGLTKWPYPVYGPIGQRLDAYLDRHPGTSDKDAKKNLTTFQIGMTEAVNYITSLLTKYSNAPLPGAGQPGTQGAFIKSNDLMEKVIAAWFSNENIAGLAAGDYVTLQKSISGITQYYNECMNCTGQNSTSTVGQDLTQNVALKNISFIAPCQNPEITAPFAENGHHGPLSRPHVHQGADYANKLTPSGSTDPVIAPADGIVIYNEISGSDGYNMIILHSSPQHGIISRFFDLWAATVSVGQNVTQGQVIGRMASASEAPNVTGPHIHWELRTGASISVSGNNYTVNDFGTANNPALYTTPPGA